MTRLKKLADSYIEPTINNKDNIKSKLENAAKYFKDLYGGEFNIEGYTVILGNKDIEGFEIEICIYEDCTINRIIVSINNSNNKLKRSYIETRDQNILNAFLNHSQKFEDFVDNALNELEE